MDRLPGSRSSSDRQGRRLEHSLGLRLLEYRSGLLYSEECVRTLRTLKPGQKGTKQLLARHGSSLLCVRYRYDEDTREHLKTVELVVQRRRREREADCPGPRKLGGHAGVAAARRVALRIGWRERDLQSRVKSAGGRWDPVRRVWILKRDLADRLDLLHRVVGGGV